MNSQPQVREGMLVVSADRQELGRVVRFDEVGFVVEKGRAIPRDLEVRNEDVASIVGGRVLLARRRHDLVEAANGEPMVTEDELAEAARGEITPEQMERTRGKL